MLKITPSLLSLPVEHAGMQTGKVTPALCGGSLMQSFNSFDCNSLTACFATGCYAVTSATMALTMPSTKMSHENFRALSWPRHCSDLRNSGFS